MRDACTWLAQRGLGRGEEECEGRVGEDAGHCRLHENAFSSATLPCKRSGDNRRKIDCGILKNFEYLFYETWLIYCFLGDNEYSIRCTYVSTFTLNIMSSTTDSYPVDSLTHAVGAQRVVSKKCETFAPSFPSAFARFVNYFPFHSLIV